VTPRVLEGAKRPFIAPPGSPGDALFSLIESIVHDRSFEDVPFFDARAARAFVGSFEAMSEVERRRRMPLLFVLASTAVLHQRLVRRPARREFSPAEA
jgi:hypothetical protein